MRRSTAAKKKSAPLKKKAPSSALLKKSPAKKKSPAAALKKKKSPAAALKKKASPKKPKRGGSGDDDEDEGQCYKYPFDADRMGMVTGLKLEKAEMAALCDVRADMHTSVGLPRSASNLSSEQADKLRDLLLEHPELRLEPVLTNMYLRACKYVLARWLRPKEAVLLFGSDLGGTIYSATFKLENIDPNANVDPYVGRNAAGDYNARISHLIGHSGRALNAITRYSNALYVWFGDGHVRVYVFVQKSAPNPDGRADAKVNKFKKALEDRSAKFQGRNGEKGIALTLVKKTGKAPFKALMDDASSS
jgi:hypothetical protein